MLRTDDRSEMFSFGRKDPESAGARGIDVAEAIDFQSVPSVFARLAGCVEKSGFVCERSVWLNFVTQDDFFLVVPIVNVEIFLVGREREPIRARQIGAYEFQFAMDQAVDAAEWKLLAPIVEKLRQAERRIGKVERAVGAINEIVRAVEPLALVANGDHGQLAVIIKSRNAAIAVFVDRDAALGVEVQSVRTGLAVFADIGAGISTVRPIDGNALAFRPAIDQIVIGIAEEKIITFAHPYGALGELESAGKFFDLRVGGDDGVENRVFADDFCCDRLNAGAMPRFIEVERRGLYPDEIVRRTGHRAVVSEHGNFELLAWLRVAGEDDLVGAVPAFNDGSPALTENGCQFSVQPNLGVIVDDNLKRNGGTDHGKSGDGLGQGNAKAVPVETNFPVATACIKRCWIENGPRRIVVSRNTGVRIVVVGLDGCAIGPQVCPRDI